ncbi:MAG TPA: hypothetical protein VLF60_02720 [Candidatus Saccharimonadales bacterium]|nr:hypothetical protein [Candidatus Saccharimonadales bacterium]
MNELPVYDVVLLPPAAVRDASIAVSRQLKPLGTEFTLQADHLYPHLSLYMLNILSGQLQETFSRLQGIARQTRPLQLQASHYGHNFTEGMFEVFYHKTSEIIALQERVIAGLNPLRHGLRTKDPVGHTLADWLPQTTGVAHHNLETYGYDEVGELFKPHITFTRFVTRTTQVELATLPALSQFHSIYTQLGLFEMGEHGTCTRPVAVFELQ